MGVGDKLAELFAQLTGPTVWKIAWVPMPGTWQAWAIITTGVLVVAAIAFAIFARRAKPPTFKIELRSTAIPGYSDQENIVVMRREDAKDYFPRRYPSANTRQIDPIVISIGGKKAHVRMLLKQTQTPQTLELDPSLATAMNLDTGDPDEEFPIVLSDEWWNVWKKTFGHPSPDVRLQWNVSFWFLLLVIFVPRVLDAVISLLKSIPAHH